MRGQFKVAANNLNFIVSMSAGLCYDMLVEPDTTELLCVCVTVLDC